MSPDQGRQDTRASVAALKCLLATGPKREAPERSTSTWPELAMSGARRTYDARNLAIPRTPVLEYVSGPPKIEIDGKGCTIKLGAQKGGQA